MSMIGNLTRIPEDVRLALHNDPKAINAVLYPDFADEPTPIPLKKQGFLSRLMGKQQTPAEPKQSTIHQLEDGDTIDVDKAWHALHFLFTGSDWEGEFPQGFLVSCGEEVGDIDVGYGPAKSFTPVQVKEISEFLSSLNKDELKSRLDPDKMHKLEIYPSIWKDCKNPDDEWEYIEGGFDEMVRFVGEAAQKDMALLVYIN